MSDNIIFDEHDYYAYIGVFKERDYKCSSLILDSNTAINIEKFYYKPHKMDEKKRKATLEFLIDNISIEFVPGLAMQEACWDMSLSGINKDQFSKMENAFNNIYKMDKESLKLHSSGQGIEFHQTVGRNSSPNLNSLLTQLKCNPVLVGTYATVLKIMILQIKEKDKLKAINEYVKFVNDNLYANLAIETNIAINYFLGTSKMQEVGDKIFKFGKKNSLLNAWNTSWDIFFLRFLQKMYYEGADMEIVHPKLVTADQGLIRLANMASLEVVLVDQNESIPIISFYDNDIRPEFIEEANKIERHLYNTFFERSEGRTKIRKSTEYIDSLILQLEQELMGLTDN